MPDAELWTIDELSELVAGALRADQLGQPSGRVREVPDRRTIRWYTTIGLLDRPAEMRGRTALYGRRHLLQIVAVKRLQAEGRSLADVQRELVGATETTLERIARVPAGRAAQRFWATAAPAAPTAPVTARAGASEPAGPPAEQPAVLPAIRLGAGVTLLLGAATRQPTADDLAALRRAAGPLLAELHRLGLAEANTGKEIRS